jgi:ATP-dependent RNA helicase SUPV3L1/SUV3
MSSSPTAATLPAAAPAAAPAPAASTAAAATLNLPNTRHAARVPAHISKEQLSRIRQAAFQLPQVVKPADYIAEGSSGFEQHLDKLGLVLLQKPVAGARPSRWIAPELMDSALLHLDRVGSGPQARPLLLERSQTLSALGVTRHAGRWTRLTSHAVTVAAGDDETWKVPVLFRMPVDAEVVWAFYRSGDEAALRTALGAPLAYPFAAELVAHLQTLAQRSRSFKPRHLDSLLPRLQSECATPQALADTAGLAELKAACSRAQERWEHASSELDTLEGLNSELAFQGYPDTFQKARRAQRRVTLYVGPPNSGKTHAAFERLAQAIDGA